MLVIRTGIGWQQQWRRGRRRRRWKHICLCTEFFSSNVRRAAHRQISVTQDHREGQFCQSQAGQTYSNRKRGTVSLFSYLFKFVFVSILFSYCGCYTIGVYLLVCVLPFFIPIIFGLVNISSLCCVLPNGLGLT